MGRFHDLGEYKNKIIERILSDDDLVKAIYSDKKDFIGSLLPTNKSELVYDNIFPYRHIPDIQKETKTYLTMNFSFRSEGKSFKYGEVTFNIFTHQSLQKTSYEIIRTDYILNQIDELFNGLRGFGLGELNFSKVDDFQFLNSKYVGSSVSYNITEFN